MRFSDSIREGCRRLPKQIPWLLFNSEGNGGCVIGAAIEGAGLHSHFPFSHWYGLKEKYPELDSTARCPYGCAYRKRSRGCGWMAPIVNRGDVVVHLNNEHKKTREWIAAWYEQSFEESALDAAVRRDAERVAGDLDATASAVAHAVMVPA